MKTQHLNMKAQRCVLAFAAWLLITGPSVGEAQAGTLLGMTTSVTDPTPINLTTEGVSDWTYWGAFAVTDFDRKASGTGQITNYTQLGTNTVVLWYGNSTTFFSWTDGTPDPALTGITSGIYFPGETNGYEVTVAADTTPRLFNIYVGAWAGHIYFEAELSDGSAPAYIDETLSHDTAGGPNRRYSIIYAANSAGQTLKVRAWVISVVNPFGNVTLQAATLGPVPPLSVTQPTVSPTNHVAAGSLVTLSAVVQGEFPYYYQWQVDSGGGFVPVPNSNTNPLPVDTTSLNGNFDYRVVVTNNSGGAFTSAPVTLTVTIPSGFLRVSSDGLVGVTNVNLTAEGTLDWAHWGLATPVDFDHKDGVTSRISNYQPVGNPLEYFQFANNAQGFTWTDGTPNPTANGTTTGIYVVGLGNGFQVEVQAQQTNLLFNLYVGVYTVGGNIATLHLEASLSDGSAPLFTDETLSGSGNRRYSIIFAAGLPNQTLKVRYWVTGATDGSATLQAASLKPVPPLSVSQPTIWPTNVLAAGSIVKFSTQTEGLFPYSYEWQVDSGSGFVAIPNSDTSTLARVAPLSPGNYTYRVVVTNDSPQSATSLPATLTVTPAASTLTVTSRDVLAVETNNLTTEGALDWAHWGRVNATTFNHKSNVTSQISNFSPIGNGTTNRYTGNAVRFVWSDGTPNPTTANLSGGYTATGIWMPGIGNGYQVQVPAATTPRVLKMYVGAYLATARFEVSLSDGSAPFYFDESLTAANVSAGANRVYTITFAAPSAGPTPPDLIVKHLMSLGSSLGAGNVTLNGAALMPQLALNMQTNGQLRLTWAPGTLLEATSLAGPWATNNNTSPYTFNATDPQKFFRVQFQ